MSDTTATPDPRQARRRHTPAAGSSRAGRPRRRVLQAAAVAVLLGAGLYATLLWHGSTGHGLAGHTDAPAGLAAPPPPEVTVAAPLRETMATPTRFLGQFSAVDSVEIRAQVGGMLTEIHFQDGQIVHKGDLLFVIDPRPFQIAFERALAGQQTAQAQLDLATQELWRAQQLRQTSFGTAETVDQRIQQQRSAAAALDQAKAAVHSASLNLEFTHITAPFTGRISTHRVSVGSLVAGSDGGGGATTLLTTLVSLDPIHLDFDMSENDYLQYRRAQLAQPSGDADAAVQASVGDEDGWNRRGTLDFIDNQMDRGSGTIHARATFANHDLFLAPGQFARLRVALSPPRPMLLIPSDAISLDQAQQSVMTVDASGTVVMKPVSLGAEQDGLSVVKSGLAPTDRVIINGLMRAMPGGRVTPVAGAIQHQS